MSAVDGGLVCEGELLQAQLILCLVERGERMAATKMQTDARELLVEAADEVEDEYDQ